MSAALVLDELRAAGASVSVEAGGLRVRAPRPLPPELLARARTLKPALLELLASPPPAAPAEPPELLGLDPTDPVAVDLAALPQLAPVGPGGADNSGQLGTVETATAAPPPGLILCPDCRKPTLAAACERCGWVPRARRPYQLDGPASPVAAPAPPPAPARWPAADDDPSPALAADVDGADAPPELPPAPPPDETPAERAARFGFVILPGGSYVEAHRARGPHQPPFLPRFDVRWRPSDSPAHEEERQAQRAAAAAECAQRLGPLPQGRPERS